MPGDLRILVADDHTVVADALSHRLAQWYNVLPPVNSLAELASCTWEASPPDVVLLDLSFGSDSALSALPSLIKQHHHVAFVICTMHTEALFAEAALSAGAAGYFVKTGSLEQLRSVIDHASTGGATVYGVHGSSSPPPRCRRTDSTLAAAHTQADASRSTQEEIVD